MRLPSFRVVALASLWRTAYSRETVPLRLPGSSYAQTLNGEAVRGKLGLLFLLHGCFKLEPLWLQWLSGASPDAYRIVVHQDGLQGLTEPPLAFVGPGVAARNAVHIKASRAPRKSERLATLSLDLLREAYNDDEVQCFLIISGTTIPLTPFAELRAMYLDTNGHCRYAVAVGQRRVAEALTTMCVTFVPLWLSGILQQR